MQQAALKTAAALSEGALVGQAGSPGSPVQRTKRSLTVRRLRQWPEAAAEAGEGASLAVSSQCCGSGWFFTARPA